MHFAIFQNWGIGDLVMTSPVIAEFRRLYPNAKLTLVVRGKAQVALLRGSPLLDQVLEMPARSDRLALLRFFMDLRRQNIDVAFVGTRISIGVPWLLRGLARVPVVIGDSDKLRSVYSVCNKIESSVHRVDRMLETFSLWSQQPPMPPHFPIPRDESALQDAHAALSANGLQSGRFLLLHPGSSVSSGTDKRIPVHVARLVANGILDQCSDLFIAYIFGPDEVDYIPRFAGLGRREVILSGYSLPTTIAIITQAAGLIGTDSSLGHIAAALGIPTITLCGPTIPSETAPYGKYATIVKRPESLACQPCWGTPLYGRCPYGVRCMDELPISQIVETAASWTERHPLNGTIDSG
ncbi:glycosyltransferase family 9 protein [Mycolicibacterium elephantis]